MVQREIAAGDMTPLDDVFPSLVSKPGNQALPKAFENSSSHSRGRFRSIRRHLTPAAKKRLIDFSLYLQKAEKSSCQEPTSAGAIIMAV